MISDRRGRETFLIEPEPGPSASAGTPEGAALDLLEKQVERYLGAAARLSNNCVQVKTWCVTAVGAVSALAVNNQRASLFGVALAILGLFMLLDVNYLWLERRFRDGAHDLVAEVASPDKQKFFATRPPGRSGSRFGVGIRKRARRYLGLRRGGVGEVLFSFTVLPFYLVVAALLIAGLATT